MPWIIFAAVQIVQLVAMLAGLLILIPFCLARAWTSPCVASIKDDKRSVDMWAWKPLNYVYGNPEDGVSGRTALIWINPQQQAAYMPFVWAPWRAYCWSAWRNSCNQLKYVFAWNDGPLITYTMFKRVCRIGWQEENGRKVPVFSPV